MDKYVWLTDWLFVDPDEVASVVGFDNRSEIRLRGHQQPLVVRSDAKEVHDKLQEHHDRQMAELKAYVNDEDPED